MLGARNKQANQDNTNAKRLKNTMQDKRPRAHNAMEANHSKNDLIKNETPNSHSRNKTTNLSTQGVQE